MLAILGLLALITAVLLTSEQPEYIIYDGDEVITAVGKYKTIASLLASVPITLRDEDIVQPTLATQPDTDTPIHIQHATPVTLRMKDGSPRTIWTTQNTVGTFLRDNSIRWEDNDEIYADGRRIKLNAIDFTALPDVIEIGRFHTIIIRNGKNQQTIRTNAATVGDALTKTSIILRTIDGVDPPVDRPITSDMEIVVQHAAAVTIYADDKIIQTSTHSDTVLDVLTEAGITLTGEDFSRPAVDTPITPNSEIVVVRITEDFRLEDVPIPYQTIWQADAGLLIDTKAIISAGSAGLQRQRIRVRYENGSQVSETVDKEWAEINPVNEVIGYGTRIEISVVETEQGARAYWRKMEMRVTSYTAATSGKERGDPAYGITASGRMAGKGVVGVARSVVPFLSELYIPEYGIGFVGDTGGGVHGRWVDLGFDEEDFESWSGSRMIYWLTPVPPANEINYLVPEGLPQIID